MTDLLTFENELVGLWAMLLLPIGLSVATVPLTRWSFLPLGVWMSFASATAVGHQVVPRGSPGESQGLALLVFAGLIVAISVHVVVVGAALVEWERTRRSHSPTA